MSSSEPWNGLTREVELGPHNELDYLYVFLSEPWNGLTREVKLDPHSELDCLYVFVRTLERSDKGVGTRPSW